MLVLAVSNRPVTNNLGSSKDLSICVLGSSNLKTQYSLAMHFCFSSLN